MNEYFYLPFQNKEEAAALVAALTRYLNYPHGSLFLTHQVRPEIWWNSESMTLAFNKTSRDAIVKEFGNMECTAEINPSEKTGFINLFELIDITPLGIDDAKTLLVGI